MSNAFATVFLMLALVGALLAWGAYSSGQLGTRGGNGLFAIGVVLFVVCAYAAGAVVSDT